MSTIIMKDISTYISFDGYIRIGNIEIEKGQPYIYCFKYYEEECNSKHKVYYSQRSHPYFIKNRKKIYLEDFVKLCN